mgnify:CR=1 FL=1
MKKYLRLFFLFALIGASLSGWAQNDTLDIEGIIVKGKKASERMKTTIAAESIETKRANDVGELFQNQAGFGIVKRGNYAMEPVLRGFKYEQLNVIIDGGITSSNACPNRMDPAISQISPENIQRVEVIKGPYNVRYGSSMGGIVNLVTKSPGRAVQDFTVAGSVNTGFESNGDNKLGNIQINMADKGYDLLFNASFKEFGNYESGSGQEIASAFSRKAYGLKLGLNTGENQRLQIGWRQGFGSDILHAGLPMDADKDNSSLLSVDYKLKQQGKTISSFTSKVYGSFVDHEMSNNRRPNYRMVHAVTPVEATVYGGRAELGINASANDLLYVGVDYKSVAKDGKRFRDIFINPCTGQEIPDAPMEAIDKVWQNSMKNKMGVFLENKFQLSPSVLWTTGFRADMVSYSNDDPAEDFVDQYGGDINVDDKTVFSVNTSINWQIDDGLTLEWAAGRGMRAADLTETYINHLSIGMDAYEYVGNPSLDAEINYQTDLRLEKRWDKAGLFANVFYSYLENYITARVDTTIPRKFMPCKDPKFAKRFTNIDEAYMYGFESGVDFVFADHFKLYLAAAYTYAQNKTWDEPLSEIPPFTVNTALAWKKNAWDIELSSRIAAEQDRVAETFDEAVTPGFSIINFSLDYELAENTSLHFAVNNVLDENYYEHLSRAYKNMDEQMMYYEPGRNFNLGLTVNF